jgi:hypothetical protein
LFWADPRMRSPHEINTNHGGRGVYLSRVLALRLTRCIVPPTSRRSHTS